MIDSIGCIGIAARLRSPYSDIPFFVVFLIPFDMDFKRSFLEEQGESSFHGRLHREVEGFFLMDPNVLSLRSFFLDGAYECVRPIIKNHISVVFDWIDVLIQPFKD